MASTYVNDLRLNEMATGDGSGTWGTTTNTNLELIAEHGVVVQKELQELHTQLQWQMVQQMQPEPIPLL